MHPMYYSKYNRRKTDKIKELLYKRRQQHPFLQCDPLKEYLSPYAGYAMEKTLKSIKAKVLVSTREDLHLFLLNCTSKDIDNKVYFFIHQLIQ